MRIQPLGFFRARQCIKFGPVRVLLRQEGFFPMQNRRIVVVGIIGMPCSAGDQVNRDRVAQGGMGIVQKIRVAQERNLEFIRPEFDDIEFFVESMLCCQNGQQLIQFPAEISVRLPEYINRCWQSFAMFECGQVLLIFLNLHGFTLANRGPHVHP